MALRHESGGREAQEAEHGWLGQGRIGLAGKNVMAGEQTKRDCLPLDCAPAGSSSGMVPLRFSFFFPHVGCQVIGLEKLLSLPPNCLPG